MTKQEKFENEEVSVCLTRGPNCVVEVDVIATPALVLKARKKALKEAAKGVTVAGFRKGKAPEDLLVKNYPDLVEDKWQKEIANLSYISFQKLANVPLLNRDTKITFDLKNHSIQDGATLYYSYETEPTPPSIDISKFDYKEVEKKPIGQTEIDEYTRQVQMYYAEWNEITDRPVQEKDFVLLDIEDLEQDPPKKIYSDTRFEVTKTSMADWMREMILGKKSQESIEGVSKPDEDATEEEKKQITPKKVRITINKIQEPKLPELNDDFARGLNLTSIEEFFKFAKDKLESLSEEKADMEKRKQVNNFLMKEYSFDLPSSLIEAELNHRKKQNEENPQFKAAMEKMSAQDKTNYEETLYKEAKDSVSLFYLSRKVILDANIQVTNQEIQQEAEQILAQAGIKNPDMKDLPNELMALSVSKLLLKKAQNYILEKKVGSDK